MIRIFWIFVSVLTLVLSLEARNNLCITADEITQMNNLSEAKTYTKTGNLSVTDLDDFFKFTPKNNGKLTIDYSSSKETNIYIKSTTKGCLDAALVVNSKSKLNTKSYSVTIDVKKNETVYIRASKLLHLLGQSTTYSIKMSFDTGGYSIDWQDSINGNIKVIGNSVLREKGNKCPSDNTDNNDIDTVFANIDKQSSNSTSAYLTIPEGAEVKYATLYWQGYFENKPLNINKNKKIKFKPAGKSDYKELESDNRYRGVNISDERYAYQGAVEVTDMIKESISKGHYRGNYFVADLKTDTGTPKGGAYGAWALVVVYEDINETYKNITIYDGFEMVSKSDGYPKRDFKLTGFLTPLKNTVNSTFLYFVGEGDTKKTGDTVSLTKKNGSAVKLENSHKPKNNAFNSRISIGDTLVTDRNPNCKNTIGIDIGSFDVGSSGQNIIEKGQTETRLDLVSEGDGFFPGMFAFATDLYKPDVCYTAMRVFEVDKEDPSKTIKELNSGAIVDINTTIRVQATIRNKSTDEHAHKVRLSHHFSPETPYRTGSLLWGNPALKQTDVELDDFAHFNSSANRIFFHLGEDANSTDGGRLERGGGESAPISFARDLNDSSKLVLKYQVDYSNHENKEGSLNLENNTIFECSGAKDFILNVGHNTLRVYDEGKGKLLTKIVGNGTQDYSLDTSGITGHYKYDSDPDLFIDLTPKETLTGNEVWTKVGTIRNPDLSKLKKIPIPNKAMKEARFAFKIGKGINPQDDEIEETEARLSGNSFAIRPAKFDISKSELLGLVGHEVEIEVIKAVSLSGNSAPNYNTTLNFNSSFNETTLNSNNCAVTQFGGENSIVYKYEESILSKGQVIFANGAGSFEKGKIAFSDVGKFELILRDKDWASLDAYEQACIQGSDENTPDDDGKIGCDIAGSIDVEIVPNELAISFTDQRSWSYMADQPDFGDRNLSHMHLTGVVEGYKELGGKRELARNLHGGCYEPSVTVSLTSNNEKWKIDHEIGGNGKEFTGGDRNDTHLKHSWKNDSGDHRIGQFQKGEAPFSVYAAVDRISPKLVKNPESLKLDLELKSELEGKGTNLTKKIATHDHTFYYGRFYAPRNITSYKNTAEINYQLEIYCPDKNCMGKKPATLNNWVIADQDSLTKITSKEKGEEGKKIEFASGVFSWGDAPVKQHDDKTIVYHHSIPSYLWYGAYVKDYEFDSLEKTDCLSHPCTEVKFQGDQDEWGGTAGDQEKNRIKAEDKSGATQDIRPRINW